MFDKKPRKVNSVVMVPTGDIDPSPSQTRRPGDQDIYPLAKSIASCGLINPITLRRSDDRYIVVAGHRRLEACKLLELHEIAAIILDSDEDSAAALTIIENLHRRELGCFEEARGIMELMERCHMSQSKVCRILALSQPALSNKLRLLRLPAAVQNAAADRGLGERVCRSLLRLPEEPDQLKAVEHIAACEMNTAQSEAYIESLLTKKSPAKPACGILRDYRLLFSTVDRAVEEIRRSGIDVISRRNIEDEYICYTIRIPKARPRPAEDPQLSLYARRTG